MGKNKQTFGFMNRTKKDFRRLSNDIMSFSTMGRITLDLLRDISIRLIDFASCDVVEIAYVERSKMFHSNASRGHTPAFFCETVNQEDSLEMTFPKVLKLPFEQAMLGDKPYSVDTSACMVRFDNEKCAFRSILQLTIPVGNRIRGFILLAFPESSLLTEETSERLEDVCRSLGLAFSYNRSQFELRERVKELTCMYGIANLAAGSQRKLKNLLERIVSLLPQAWLYPEITEASIIFDGVRHSTPGFLRTEFHLSAEIVVNDEVRGAVEVTYIESRPELDEGPFLMEERHLIDSIAREVAIIIQRRQAEKEQQRLYEQLQHAERLATIGQLAAGVAHELNQPLTGVLGFAELLKELDGMPRQAFHDIERIESASLHAREIVQKLLIFARQVPTRNAKVNVNTVIRDVISFFKGRLLNESIEVKTELSPELPSITADQTQVRQIIVNLFVNAAHAMPQGGNLTIKTVSDRKTVRMEISDTGMGMTDEVKEKAYLPFFTTKDVNQGTGLGLSVVHGIIKAHHGRIQLKSGPGEGTTFTIDLPIEQQADE